MRITIKTRVVLLVNSVLLYSSIAIAGDIAPLVSMCEGCHGKDGISIQPDIPIIAGFSNEGFLSFYALQGNRQQHP